MTWRLRELLWPVVTGQGPGQPVKLLKHAFQHCISFVGMGVYRDK